MNSINLVGRLTKEPELKTTANGNKVTSFCLAVDRRTKDKATDFIDCIAWNKLAEVISQYCHKGKMISVTGSLQTRMWEDNTGGKHKASEVNVMSMDLLGGNEKSGNAQSETAMTSEPQSETADTFATFEPNYPTEGELPFQL